MADENQTQGSEQEQEQVQGAEPVQDPAEEPQDKPSKEKKGDGLLMPILYALLAAAGVFTLIMIAGIVVTIITRPAEPSESPSAEPPAQVTQAQSSQAPESESSYPDNES